MGGDVPETIIDLSGTVTVAGKPGIEVPPGTLNSIFKQAGLK
jgi:predicted RNA binding protein YcfA (HicA-like mRNA interferase family)